MKRFKFNVRISDNLQAFGNNVTRKMAEERMKEISLRRKWSDLWRGSKITLTKTDAKWQRNIVKELCF